VPSAFECAKSEQQRELSYRTEDQKNRIRELVRLFIRKIAWSYCSLSFWYNTSAWQSDRRSDTADIVATLANIALA